MRFSTGSRSHHLADNLFDGLSLVELVKASECLEMTHDTRPNDAVNSVLDEHVHRRRVTLRRPLQVHRNTVRVFRT